tara:strand:- start:1872 stop:2300 length:429 start_codon:yes stop_codon:yes gene_type:complete
MKKDDWSDRLNTYIDDVRELRFQWGANDCLTFANTAHEAMTGSRFAPDWSGNYRTAHTAKRWYSELLEKQGFSTIIEAIDARLERLHVSLPPRGSIVGRTEGFGAVTEVALGVCVGEKVAFISRDGVVFLTVQSDDIFWAVN